MTISLDKAKTLVGIYRNNGFRAGQALRDMGYSESMALKKPGETINRAYKVIAQHEMMTALDSKNPKSELLKLLETSEYDVATEYRSIITQNKNLGVKLKA